MTAQATVEHGRRRRRPSRLTFYEKCTQSASGNRKTQVVLQIKLSPSLRAHFSGVTIRKTGPERFARVGPRSFLRVLRGEVGKPEALKTGKAKEKPNCGKKQSCTRQKAAGKNITNARERDSDGASKQITWSCGSGEEGISGRVRDAASISMAGNSQVPEVVSVIQERGGGKADARGRAIAKERHGRQLYHRGGEIV